MNLCTPFTFILSTFAESSASFENTEKRISSILQFIFLDRHKLSDTWCFEITAATRQLPEHGWLLLRKNAREYNPSTHETQDIITSDVHISPLELEYNIHSSCEGCWFWAWGRQVEIRFTIPYTISHPAAPWCDGQVSTSRLKITNIINEARTRHQPSPALQ